MKQFLAFILLNIFTAPAFAVAPVCGLPIGACGPTPCSYRSQVAGTFTIVNITGIPMNLVSPPDACDVLGSTYLLTKLPSDGLAQPAWMLSPPIVSLVPSVNLTYTYTQWVTTVLAGAPGLCGTADATTRAAAPALPAELCANGVPSAVAGAGPWTWTCTDATVANCSAAVGAVPGLCGPMNGVPAVVPPAGAGLCAGGVPSAVDASATPAGPYSWSCVGSTTVACTAAYGAPWCMAQCIGVFVWLWDQELFPTESSPLCHRAVAPPGKFALFCTPYNGAVCSYPPLVWSDDVPATCNGPAVAGVCGPADGTGPLAAAPPMGSMCAAGVLDFYDQANLKWRCLGAPNVNCGASPFYRMSKQNGGICTWSSGPVTQAVCAGLPIPAPAGGCLPVTCTCDAGGVTCP